MTKFSAVSMQQYVSDGGRESDYKEIILPCRATSGSAGYDFFAAYPFEIAPGESLKILTGVRCMMDPDRVLVIFPRSSLGFKYSVMLSNTAGIIDSDYYGAKNEGHIMIKLTNRGDKVLSVEKGKAFAQGIFLNYLLTDDDSTTGERTGGMGSTDKKQ